MMAAGRAASNLLAIGFDRAELMIELSPAEGNTRLPPSFYRRIDNNHGFDL